MLFTQPLYETVVAGGEVGIGVAEFFCRRTSMPFFSCATSLTNPINSDFFPWSVKYGEK